MYKIFINDKPLIITNNSSLVETHYVDLPIEQFKNDAIIDYFKLCEGLNGKGIVLITSDVEDTFNLINKHLMPIEAAGGAVFNLDNNLLLIKRMGKWDLPKGKIDFGETPEIAAIREVEEECGINELKLGKKITITYHTYKMHNHRFLKITHWYMMQTTFTGKLIPQADENITHAEWHDLNTINLALLDTYNSIKNLLYLIKEQV